ncbi:hypothetical protein H2200_006565 [Cladophialophora chaetospira]|uniref:Uncharacterized protein n=1 Tax=Cladophialophora chaetospira TaxID=386627 RepID=A0AA38X8M1_9EURO|nr:hypothetical protein H2200_006565 [Cladophialophora chaetospira]
MASDVVEVPEWVTKEAEKLFEPYRTESCHRIHKALCRPQGNVRIGQKVVKARGTGNKPDQGVLYVVAVVAARKCFRFGIYSTLYKIAVAVITAPIQFSEQWAESVSSLELVLPYLWGPLPRYPLNSILETSGRQAGHWVVKNCLFIFKHGWKYTLEECITSKRRVVLLSDLESTIKKTLPA